MYMWKRGAESGDGVGDRSMNAKARGKKNKGERKSKQKKQEDVY